MTLVSFLVGFALLFACISIAGWMDSFITSGPVSFPTRLFMGMLIGVAGALMWPAVETTFDWLGRP